MPPMSGRAGPKRKGAADRPDSRRDAPIHSFLPGTVGTERARAPPSLASVPKVRLPCHPDGTSLAHRTPTWKSDVSGVECERAKTW